MEMMMKKIAKIIRKSKIKKLKKKGKENLRINKMKNMNKKRRLICRIRLI
jgi:hypothetical protein